MLRAAWRNVRAHFVRFLLSGLAIVLGVGFVVGTFIFTDTLNKTFTDLFTQTTSDVVVTPKSTVNSDVAGQLATLPEAALATVSGTEGIARAGGAVLVDGVTILGANDTPLGVQGAPHFGSNWGDDPDLSPFRLESGHGPESGDQVAIDSVSAQKGELSVGDQVRLVTPDGAKTKTLVGIFRYGSTGNLAGATIAAFDLPTAQNLLLGGTRGFTEIDAVASDGVSQQQAAEAVRVALGPDVKVQTGKEAADQAASDLANGLKFINIFLLVFAGIALFVGIFIILNTFAILVGQRSKELALLRAVGATRSQVNRSVLTEAFIVGVVASVIGILFGIGVSYALQGLFKAIGADIPTGGLVIKPSTVVIGLVVGIVITLVSALVPAWRAARVPPIAAMRDDAVPAPRSLRLRAIVGATVLVLGIALLVLAVAANSGGSTAGLAGLGIVAILVGAIVVSPAMSQRSIAGLAFFYPRLFGTVGRLAVDSAQRQPRRTAATASALMIGLALVSMLTVFAASTKASTNLVLDQVVGADFLVYNSAQTPFPGSVADRIATVPGVSVVSATQVLPAKINGKDAAPTGIDPATVLQVINLQMVQGTTPQDLAGDSIGLDTKTAKSDGLTLGDTVRVTFGGPIKNYTLTALYEPVGFFTGWIISTQTLADAGITVGDSVVYVKTSPGADQAQVGKAISTALVDYPTVVVKDQSQFKQEISNNINQLLAVMVLLLGLAIFIAILGIVNTLVLTVLERTRELGMLRAVGATRRQVRKMVVLESIAIAVYGALLGIVIGVVFATAFQRILSDQGITVLSIPWIQLAVFLVLAAIVGWLAALWPAFRAGRVDVLRAVTSE
jgi:putative ABC transport system permease protein